MILLTADLHLTDRPQDKYRFEYLKQLEKLVVKHRIRYLIILGDLTESKDSHSADLVNHIAKYINKLSALCEVIVLKGNHDYTEPSCPFFGFLAYFRNVKFIIEPVALKLTTLDGRNTNVLMLPHTRIKEGYRGDFAFEDFDIICCHQTFEGATSDNGRVLDGISPMVFAKTDAKVYAGDIHLPQKVGRVEYIGSPYPINFGDSHTPRFIVDPGGVAMGKTYHVFGIQKLLLTITNPEQLRNTHLNKNDQIKVVVSLPRKDFVLWEEYKIVIQRLCKNTGVELHSLELKENVRQRIPLGDTGVDPGLLVSSAEVYGRYCDVNRSVIDTKLEAFGKRYL